MHKTQILKIVRVVMLITLTLNCPASVITASEPFANESRPSKTEPVFRQTDGNFEDLVAEASRNMYTARRVEFAGNNLTRDNKLRRGVIKEGAVFTRAGLVKSLNNLKKMDVLKSARVGEIRLDRENGLIDIVFEVVESDKAKRR